MIDEISGEVILTSCGTPFGGHCFTEITTWIDKDGNRHEDIQEIKQGCTLTNTSDYCSLTTEIETTKVVEKECRKSCQGNYCNNAISAGICLHLLLVAIIFKLL